ncbi:MAG TPA: hypothetical protein VH092_20240 [Urbifossiella sp.]|jgi:hypothetical protein|nr:hypothetical protein [Urbifossiella sp.]
MARKKADTEAEPTAEAAPTEKITKADAVRAALAEGIDTPDEGIAFILKRYGIEMGKPMWSSYRSQEKARQAKKAGGGTPARRSRAPKAEAAPAPAPAASSPSRNGSIGVAGSVETIKSLVEQYGVDEVVSLARLFGK